MGDICPVYVVEGDASTRRRLVGLLRTHHYQPIPFASGQDFLDALKYLAPGICLIELQLNDMNGIAVLEELRLSRRDIPAIMTTTRPDIRTAVDATKRGADDFIGKPFTDHLLLQMVGNALPILKSRIDGETKRQSILSSLETLTKREAEIMAALKNEGGNADVANKLHISVRTVEAYRTKIIKKLGVKRFSDAILLLSDINCQ